jgi:hypothetical protein
MSCQSYLWTSQQTPFQLHAALGYESLPEMMHVKFNWSDKFKELQHNYVNYINLYQMPFECPFPNQESIMWKHINLPGPLHIKTLFTFKYYTADDHDFGLILLALILVPLPMLLLCKEVAGSLP